MDQETLDIEQLASLLQRDVREVTKLASRGHLPGQKIAGQWRFASAEINYWLETQIPDYDENQLSALETGVTKGQPQSQPLISTLLGEATIATSLNAGTKASVLKELIGLAEQSWQVYDPDALLEAIKHREEMGSTALPSGVAIPHPRRPNPNILGDSVIAFAHTPRPIPFGGDRGGMCDLFFLVCCRDHSTHLQVLARLSRLFLQEGFVNALRDAITPAEVIGLIQSAESELVD